MNFHYVQRFKDGVEIGMVDIPSDQVAEVLTRNPDWKDLGEVKMHKISVPELKIGITECPICGFEAKNEFGLNIHKKKHYA